MTSITPRKFTPCSQLNQDDWTESEAFNFVMEQVMKFESDEAGNKHFIHQAFIDDGYDSLFLLSEISEEG